MNRKYIPAYMEIIEFESEDIITTSDITTSGEAEDDVSGDEGGDDFCD